MKKHTNLIECPECKRIQTAQIELTYPWFSYVHECTQCKYIIMESEWNKIKFSWKFLFIPFINTLFLNLAIIGAVFFLFLMILEIIFTLKAGKMTAFFINIIIELYEDINKCNFFTKVYLLKI